ncbi:hypothetical protein [Halonotius aquaticus]|uniref:hypothetical protein n=1 Tax=Halonotius aquaticus TaxID=2216978 RepID=UPI001058C8BA|nr:hypothetical protein [Halonotius aquaticus]
MVAQDYDALTDRIRSGREDGGTDEEVQDFRQLIMSKWSSALFGTGNEANLIPYGGESSNLVFDAMYNDGNTEALVELNQAYAESDFVGSDQVVSAQYTGNGWQFEAHPDYEMGEKLPANQ